MGDKKDNLSGRGEKLPYMVLNITIYWGIVKYRSKVGKL